MKLPSSVTNDVHQKKTVEFQPKAGSALLEMMREIASEPIMPNVPKDRGLSRAQWQYLGIIGGLIASIVLVSVGMEALSHCSSDFIGLLVVLLIMGVGTLFYFLPTITACLSCHPHWAAIAALNVLLGWTLLGWVIAFVWSLTAVRQRV